MAYIYRFIPKSYFGLSQESIFNIVSQTQAMFRSVADSSNHYCRIVIHNSPYTLDSYIKALTIQRARCGDKKWMTAGLTSMINSLRFQADKNLFQPYVYLVLFDKRLEDANEFATLFEAQTGMTMVQTPTSGAGLPQIVETVARITDKYIFTPPNRYWKTIYITGFEGEHDVFKPVFELVRQPFELMVSFDIMSYANANLGQKLDITMNQTLAEYYRNTYPASRQGIEERLEALRQVRELVAAKQESLHELTGAIAFSAPTLEKLQERQGSINAATTGFYKLAIPRGMQAQALRRFTTDHPTTCPQPGEIKKTVISSNLAIANVVGNGFPEPGGNDGIWYGNSYLNGHPILYDGFGPNRNDANHTIILGATGSGKTVALQTWAYRSLLAGMQVIVMEPRGHFRRLHSLLPDESAYNDMGFASKYSINIFDPVYRDLNDQVGHVITALSLLLKKEFDETENAVLRNEITSLYRNYDSIILENLVYALRQEKWANHQNPQVREAAANIADLIDISIINTEIDKVFNRNTSGIDLNLDTVSLSIFDFEKVSADYQGLLYFLILANIHSYFVGKRHRSRNAIIIVDEYYLMSQIPQLAESLALFFKTFRTYGVAVWVAEQDWYTLTGFEGQRNKHGEYLVSNAANVVALYHNTLKDARALANIIPELNEDLLSYITGTKRAGTGVLKLKEKMMPFRLELTEQERNLFIGS